MLCAFASAVRTSLCGRRQWHPRKITILWRQKTDRSSPISRCEITPDSIPVVFASITRADFLGFLYRATGQSCLGTRICCQLSQVQGPRSKVVLHRSQNIIGASFIIGFDARNASSVPTNRHVPQGSLHHGSFGVRFRGYVTRKGVVIHGACLGTDAT
jgi:hypothetical protein